MSSSPASPDTDAARDKIRQLLRDVTGTGGPPSSDGGLPTSLAAVGGGVGAAPVASGGKSLGFLGASSSLSSRPGVVPSASGPSGTGGLFSGGFAASKFAPKTPVGSAFPPPPSFTPFRTPGGGDESSPASASASGSVPPGWSATRPRLSSQGQKRGAAVAYQATSASDDTYELTYYDGNQHSICGGKVSSGTQVCVSTNCPYAHTAKMFDKLPGPCYLVRSHNKNGAAFVDPILPAAKADASSLFNSLKDAQLQRRG